ncbi:MAG: TolC family protein, partial [Paludibacteraceae bacterium]|nr:TolC family protein [Paludibacteraceae bacterium]
QSDVTAKLELQTQKIWDELDAAYRSYLLADQAVDDASSNLRLSTQYYTSGLISLSELLEAQTLYRNALDTRIEQSITYLVCLRHYKQITGQ